MSLVAEGISEALVTTETGLVIALPGLFFQYQLVRKHERYKAFLAHLETVCTQRAYKKLHRHKVEPATSSTERITFEAGAACREREPEELSVLS